MLPPGDVAISVRGDGLSCCDRPMPDLNVPGGGAVDHHAPDETLPALGVSRAHRHRVCS